MTFPTTRPRVGDIRSQWRTAFTTSRRWALADQLLSSVTNSIPLVVAAVLIDDSSVLGEVAVVGALVMLATEVARAWVVLPAQLWETSGGLGRLGTKALLDGLPVALIALLIGLVLHSTPVVVAACCLPGVAAFETIRAMWLGQGRSLRAVWWDGAWMLITALGIIVGALVLGTSPTALVAMWLVPGAGLGFVMILWQLPMDVIDDGPKGAVPVRVRATYLLDSSIGQLSNAVPIALAVFMGTDAAALWIGARLAFRPIGIGANLLPILVPPRIVHDQRPATATAPPLASHAMLVTVLATMFCFPVAIALQTHRGLSFAVAAVWGSAVMAEYVFTNGFTVFQVMWKAIGAPVTALVLRSIVTVFVILGIFVAVLTGEAIWSQCGVVLGTLLVLIWSRRSSTRMTGCAVPNV